MHFELYSVYWLSGDQIVIMHSMARSANGAASFLFTLPWAAQSDQPLATYSLLHTPPTIHQFDQIAFLRDTVLSRSTPRKGLPHWQRRRGKRMQERSADAAEETGNALER